MKVAIKERVVYALFVFGANGRPVDRRRSVTTASGT